MGKLLLMPTKKMLVYFVIKILNTYEVNFARLEQIVALPVGVIEDINYDKGLSIVPLKLNRRAIQIK
jgi:hypothetical protein